MAKVTSTITLNMPIINKLDKAAVRALEMTTEALHTEIVQSEVMPRDTGALQNEKTYVDVSESNAGHAEIVSEGPYARRLYYHPEYNFQKYENAFAGGKWFEPWMKGGVSEDFAVKAFAKLYKREAGL